MDQPNRLPVLLLLHGAALNGRMWDPVRRHLDMRYPVMTPDLPGHGTRRDERYTLAAAVEVVRAKVLSVAPAQVILVGDSLGGYTAMAASAAMPAASLAGLVISGATYDFRGPTEFRAVARGWMLRSLAALIGEQRLINKLMPKALGAQGFGLAPADAKAIMEAGMSIQVYGQAVKAVRAEDWRAVVAEISQPLLIVNGDEDAPNVRDEANFLALAPHATSVRFACKHGVTLWKPQEFAGVVNEFAARITFAA